MSTQSEDSLTDLVAALQKISDSRQNALSEIRRLQSIQKWALDQQPIKAGQAVTITDKMRKIEPSSGWYSARECLVPGSTGIAREVDYNESHGYWYAYFVPDVEWTRSSLDGRIFVPEDERRHSYMMNVEWLRPRTDDDVPLVVPKDDPHQVEAPYEPTTGECRRCGKPVRRTNGVWIHVAGKQG